MKPDTSTCKSMWDKLQQISSRFFLFPWKLANFFSLNFIDFRSCDFFFFNESLTRTTNARQENWSWILVKMLNRNVWTHLDVGWGASATLVRGSCGLIHGCEAEQSLSELEPEWERLQCAGAFSHWERLSHPHHTPLLTHSCREHVEDQKVHKYDTSAESALIMPFFFLSFLKMISELNHRNKRCSAGQDLY